MRFRKYTQIIKMYFIFLKLLLCLTSTLATGKSYYTNLIMRAVKRKWPALTLIMVCFVKKGKHPRIFVTFVYVFLLKDYFRHNIVKTAWGCTTFLAMLWRIKELGTRAYVCKTRWPVQKIPPPPHHGVRGLSHFVEYSSLSAIVPKHSKPLRWGAVCDILS